MAILKVYGIPESDMEQLKKIALKETGKDSISHFTKTILSELANKPIQPINKPKNQENNKRKERTVLRLSASEKNYFQKAAHQHEMSVSAFIRRILQHHITAHPTLSNAEITALYQSNYQLLRIGRNINQIARQLNTMESTEFSTRHIEALQKTINEHTQKVQNLMSAHQERFR